MDRAPGYAPSRPTVFVAEGLTMYLTELEVTALFRSVAELLTGGGRLIGTALAPRPDGSLRVTGAPSWLDRHLRRVGEPFRFGIAPDALPGFVAGTGFDGAEVARVPDVLAMFAAGRSVASLPELGEYLFSASVGSDRRDAGLSIRRESDHRVASVDHQIGARDPGRLVGGEKDRGPRVIVGHARPAQRDALGA